MPLNIKELKAKLLNKNNKGDPVAKLIAYWLLTKATSNNNNKVKPDSMPG